MAEEKTGRAKASRTFDSAYGFSFSIAVGLALFIAGLVMSRLGAGPGLKRGLRRRRNIDLGCGSEGKRRVSKVRHQDLRPVDRVNNRGAIRRQASPRST